MCYLSHVIVSWNVVYRKYLNPEEKPMAEFNVTRDNFTAREYCNLHGHWKNNHWTGCFHRLQKHRRRLCRLCFYGGLEPEWVWLVFVKKWCEEPRTKIIFVTLLQYVFVRLGWSEIPARSSSHRIMTVKALPTDAGWGLEHGMCLNWVCSNASRVYTDGVCCFRSY